MSRLDFTEEILDALVIGGSFYGGGGGGAPETGRQVGLLALRMGHPYLVDLDDVPPDAVLLTVSAVGAPAGAGPHAGPEDYARAVELFQRYSGRKVGGLITNECGGLATVNGWIQSAVTGLPVVDAPCNGRAHPTGTMGSIGLHKVREYVSEHVAVGGRSGSGDGSGSEPAVEVYIKGTVDGASMLVRKVAAQVGGLVAVARNPVEASYARDHAATGAIRQCLTVGRAMIAAGAGAGARGVASAGDAGTHGAGVSVASAGKNGEAAARAAAQASGGSIACIGKIVRKELETTGGFDVGRLTVRDCTSANARTPAQYQISFVNEYLTLESCSPPGCLEGGHDASHNCHDGSHVGHDASRDGAHVGAPARLATFPDLIATLDLSTGLPVSSAVVRPEQEVAVVVVPGARLILGSGVLDRDLYPEIERIAGKDIVRYAFRS